MDKAEYRKKREDADRKRRESAEHADRQQIIGSLERIAEQTQATENQAQRADAFHRRAEKLTLRLEGKKYWLELAETAGLWAAATVGAIAIIVASNDSDKQRTVMDGQLTAMTGQLDEIKSSRKQTNDLIEVNKKLADAAVEQAEAADATVTLFQKQLSIMKGQLEQMSTAIEQTNKTIVTSNRIADAATNSSESAKISANAAQQSAANTVGLERPFFGILKIELNQTSPDDPSPTVDWSFINAGRSVAVIRELNIDCRLSPILLPLQPKYDPTKTGTTRAMVGVTNSIGSNVPINPLKKCELKQPMTADEIADFNKGNKAITLIGFIKYEGMLNLTYTKGFGVYYDRERKYFADINSEYYNYESALPRPSGAPNLSPNVR